MGKVGGGSKKEKVGHLLQGRRGREKEGGLLKGEGSLLQGERGSTARVEGDLLQGDGGGLPWRKRGLFQGGGRRFPLLFFEIWKKDKQLKTGELVSHQGFDY